MSKNQTTDYGAKETPFHCTNCLHRHVCKYKNDFLKSIEAVNELAASRLRVFDFIEDIQVRCRHRYTGMTNLPSQK